MPLAGSWQISELVHHWHSEKPSEPVVLLDLGQWREECAITATTWLTGSQAAHFAHHPLTALKAPSVPTITLTFPEFPVPRLPAVELPPISLPEPPQLPPVELPQVKPPTLPSVAIRWPREWFINTGLTIASRTAWSASIAIFLFFAGPIIILEGQSTWKKIQRELGHSRIFSNEPPPSERPTVKPTPKVVSAEDVFSLKIPDLEIDSTVVANVDPGNPQEYTAALKEGIAHARGTGLPDQLEENKTIYLFAHSTDSAWNVSRYNAEFYALKDIKPGQQIHVRFWGKDYSYTVTETKVVAADDTSYLRTQTDQEQLILQTCYPPGTTWKRLLVIATPSPATESASLE